MRKYFLLILVPIITLTSNAQTDNKIVIGKVDSVYSNALKEKRKIWVYVPNMNGDMQNSGQRFPVLYLLDGDAHFQSVSGMIQQLSQVNGNTIFPEMIVVGIPNTDRTRDLTPTHIASDPPMMDSNSTKITGGGENFATFLEKELMPHIDSLYPTQPFRLLIGHSFGGLTVMNIITNHTKLFNAYIAIDPSMWYDKERFLKATQKKLSSQNYNGTSLYVGIANTMVEGMTLEKMKKDTASDTRHIRSIFAMDQFIKANSQNGLRYASKYYGDDDHGSVPLISEYDGLRFIFSWYRFKFTRADFMDAGTEVVQRMKQHYQTVSKEFGYKVSPPEMQVNGMGYNALSQKQYDKAEALFKMNIENYPQSGNVYDSYADLLIAKKDTANAIANFQKAFAMTKSEETKLKLDQLQGKSTYTLTAKEMEKYVGAFEFETIQLVATTSIKNDALWVAAPWQGEFEFVPLSTDTFTIKGLQGYKIKFEMKDNKA
ncbi:MAG TPA: alpha/beta hydrolase-fold protein, partial [Chitinophagaceae bacterium]|nr:alpha/beta hydrolase-fold protein [Chitinophagaceae bacterium]